METTDELGSYRISECKGKDRKSHGKTIRKKKMTGMMKTMKIINMMKVMKMMMNRMKMMNMTKMIIKIKIRNMIKVMKTSSIVEIKTKRQLSRFSLRKNYFFPLF